MHRASGGLGKDLPPDRSGSFRDVLKQPRTSCENLSNEGKSSVAEVSERLLLDAILYLGAQEGHDLRLLAISFPHTGHDLRS